MVKPGLIRFTLATIVVLYHLSGSIYIGTMAVYCFFILSGYWVTFMFDKKYSSYPNSSFVFYLSRIWRIFPVYLLIGALTYLVCWIYEGQFTNIIYQSLNPHYVLSNVCLFGYNLLPYNVLVPAWSLDIELQFYALIPVIIFLSKSKFGRVAVSLLLVIASIVISLWFNDHWIQKTVVPYLSYFYMGLLIYHYKISFSKNTELIFNALFIAVLIAHYAMFLNKDYNLLKSSAHYLHLFNQLISLLTIPLLCNSVRNKSNIFDRTLGEMSYVLYLVHWPAIIVYNHYIVGLSKMQRVPVVIIYIIFTYFLAYVIYRYYDKVVDKCRRNWFEKKFLESNNKVVLK